MPERRSEVRVSAEETGSGAACTVTILGGKPDPDRQPIPAVIRDYSGSGLGLHCSTRLPAGTVIRICEADSLFLGEVCYSVPNPAGGFDVGVQLEHALNNLCQLEALRVRLLGTGPDREKHRAA